MTTESVILDAIASLPPGLAFVAYLLPVVVFVAWGPWAWVLGGVAGAWAATWGGTDALLIVGALVGAVAYALNCLWNPMADCWWCKGNAKRRDKKRHFHWCFFCGGNGRRTRLGAYAWPKHRT